MSGDRKGKLSRVHCICTIHCVQYTVEKQCTANHVIILYLPLCLYREHLNVQYDILFMPNSFQRNDLCFAQSIMLGHFPCLWGCTDDCNTEVYIGSGFFNANAWGIPLWYWKSSHDDCWLQKALNLLWWFPDLRHGCSLEWWHFTCSVFVIAVLHHVHNEEIKLYFDSDLCCSLGSSCTQDQGSTAEP